ncbi:unnamed protein product (plasmid) [Mycetohabitans rhizoxinica HKI 454]|uniref:Uncharacterized protein n=1 Tax=Mycetohabitans rhizoxinica (strain DSM 19002 / CIP 109453 / HKI 454) TaxID=882378 RepID=E5AUS0_MYCRK|nr:unnamed protein product [Mycetohabitans rhizoxinica HKI 454]
MHRGAWAFNALVVQFTTMGKIKSTEVQNES